MPTISGSVRSPLASPSAAHWLGTDLIGRDVLSRLAVGGRTTLMIAGMAVVLALGAGLGLGLAAGYMRALVAALRPTVPNHILTIAIVYTPAMAGWRAARC